MENLYKKTFGSSLRRWSLLCFLMLATLCVHAEPGKVTYYANGDGTAGFMFPVDFLYAKPEGNEYTWGLPQTKVVIPKTWNGMPIKTYGGFAEPVDAWPWDDGHTFLSDYRNYSSRIDTLIIEAQIDSIDANLPQAHVMYFPKSLKRILGTIYNWRVYNEEGNCRTEEVYFEPGSQLEILCVHEFITGMYSQNYGLEEFKIPSKVWYIGSFCLAGQISYNVCKYPLPSKLQYIGKYAFAGTTDADNLSEILTIPASVREIDYGAFQYCNGIKTVVIEDGTRLTIKESAFDGGYSGGFVQTVICKSTTPFKLYSGSAPDYETVPEDELSNGYSVGGGPSFGKYYSNGYKKPKLYVPIGCKDTYASYTTLDEGKRYDEIFDIKEGVTWGTIVVPQNNKKALDYGIARLAELESCEVKDGDTWRLVFNEKPVTSSTQLVRGKPYLCVPPRIEVSGSGTQYLSPVQVSDNGYTITYTGNVSGNQRYVPEGAYYFGSGTGKCYLNEQGNNAVKLENGRCYFEVTAPASGAKPLTMNVVLNDLDGSQNEATLVEGLLVTSKKDADTTNDAIYNLQGVRMNNKGSLPKGIYIQNGKKVIIK